MRSALRLIGLNFVFGTLLLCATERTPNAPQLARLEARVAQASPENRFFVYAELIQVSTNMAIAQMQSGAEEQASATLESVQSYASRIDLKDAKGTKKLKRAEILLGHAAFRLHELLMSAPLEDRPLLEKALAQVNKVQSALLLRVFER